MRRSGLAHLLSVSGLHVAAVVGAAMLLTLGCWRCSPRLALRCTDADRGRRGALAGIAYTLLTGAQVPTVRSCVAALLVLGGIALGREAMTLRLVAAGALIVLLFWPEALAGPSFQLSFAAVTAIVALHEHPSVRALVRAARRRAGWRGSARDLARPAADRPGGRGRAGADRAVPFPPRGLYGALANIVAIPLTTFVIMPLEALALLLDVVGHRRALLVAVRRFASHALLCARAHGRRCAAARSRCCRRCRHGPSR